ncbi:MAG: hypothetical protein JXB10_09815 [Pirellulales bacterium]|nr:hypothetical protein [Pirellulales bacterium]
MMSNFTTTGWFIFILLVVTTFSATGLGAVWAGLSNRWHWFFRMAVVVGVVALPLAIPAYELVVVIFLQSTFTVLPLWLLRRFRPSPFSSDIHGKKEKNLGKVQFLLRDLLLLTVLAALLSSIFAQVPREIWVKWPSLLLSGVILAFLTLVGAVIGWGRTRWWKRLIAICLVFPALLITVILVLCRAAGKSSGETEKGILVRRLAQTAVALLAVLMLIPPGFAYYKLLTPTPIPKTILPDPNGYQDLMQAARPFEKVWAPSDYDPPRPIKPFVVKYRSNLDKAHAALQRSCQNPLRYHWSDLDTPNISWTRNLARAFADEGKLAHQEGRDADALKIYLDEFRLADAASRGRLFVDFLVGLAIDNIGSQGLLEIRHSLSAEQCREVIDTLRKIEAGREPLQVFLERDDAWEEHAYHDWQTELGMYIYRMEGYSTKSMVEFAVNRHQAEMRLLSAAMALSGYRRAHGKLPATLDDLVPEFLPAVPQDPFTGKPLVYRRTPKGYKLYSLGPDGKDDGGQVGTAETGWEGDLLLEEPKEGEDGN